MFQPATVTLRPETDEDRPFLLDLYLSTRDDEAGFRDVDPAERRTWLEQQFAWQHAQYRTAYPHAWFTIVTVDDKPAGRLYVAPQPDALRIVDVSLLPAYRGHGIGTQLIRNIQAEATRSQLPVRLQVVHDNPARGFYTRLGFRPVSQDPVRHQLEWSPPPEPGR